MYTKSTKTFKNEPPIEHVVILALDLSNTLGLFPTKITLSEPLRCAQAPAFCPCWSLVPLERLPCCVLQIDYFNNQIIVDLVEQQHKGIIAILDDACMNVGKVTDEIFLEALNSKLGKHGHFSSRKVMCFMRTSFHFELSDFPHC